jgi:hypothetical protein
MLTPPGRLFIDRAISYSRFAFGPTATIKCAPTAINCNAFANVRTVLCE